jgi:HAD superfamily hydrolase (TIGR01549 family)
VVLFDLDDTLFDHTRTLQRALRDLVAVTPALQTRPFPELVGEYVDLLERIQPAVLAGTVTHDAARDERFRQLFAYCGTPIGHSEAHRHSVAYRARYQEVRTLVPGAKALLSAVRESALTGVVSNNTRAEQEEKARSLGLSGHLDFLLTSEEAKVAKPHPGIFAQALVRAGCSPEEAVMVGDNWSTDVLGARFSGVRSVWFNRFLAPSPAPGEVPELHSFRPTARAKAVILRGQPPHH